MNFGAIIAKVLGGGGGSGAPADPAGDIATPPPSKGNFLDNVTSTLMGKADQDLTPEERRDRSQRRAQAANMATAAMEDPGGNMNPPSGSGSGFGLQDLVSFAKKLF